MRIIVTGASGRSLGIPREAVPDQVVNAFPWSSDDMVSFESATARLISR
ncbi:MAG: hypothetical protein JWM75_1004 [Sphingomonas bacterium]|nr:hypothetical protein [Sphingomonas bacterium]